MGYEISTAADRRVILASLGVAGPGAKFAVDRRSPTEFDDATCGYAAGHRWIDHRSDVWECLRATANRASWRRLFGVAPSPAAISPSNLLAVYAVVKLVAAYSGACINVVRASDSTALDIGFTTDGNLDWAALDAFLYGTTGVIATWYDQSGNARNATASSTFRPVATKINNLGKHRGIVFDSIVSTDGSGKIKQALTIPSSVTTGERSVSVVSLAAFGHSKRNSPLVELSGTTPFCFGNREISTSLGGRFGNSTRSFTPAIQPPITPIVYGVCSGASSFVQYYRDLASRTQTLLSSNNTLAGGLIGGTTQFLDGVADPDYGYNIQGAVLIYDKQLSATEYTDVMTGLYRSFGIPPQVRASIVCDGDSITEGSYGRDLQSWPRQMLSMLDVPVQVYNVAQRGGTFETQIAGIAAWAQIYNANLPLCELVWCGGTNSISAGDSTATTTANLASYLTTARTTGNWAGPIDLVTILPRGSITAGKETVRLDYNTHVRTNYAALGCRSVIDWAADETMGVAASGANYADSTHPNLQGLSVLAQLGTENFDPQLRA